MATTESLSCFKAYDIRGKLGAELNSDIAYRIGRAYAQFTKARRVVVGGDARETSAELKHALAEGLLDEGCEVIDIGLVGSEEIYFATWQLNLDGGIIVTASHNPMDYNGMKLVRERSKPISNDSGLNEIKCLAERNGFDASTVRGEYHARSNLTAYVDHLLSYIDTAKLNPFKLVVNAGNGVAGRVIDEIEHRFKALGVHIEFIKLNHAPDSSFPNGIPNPLLVENREQTAEAVRKHQADIGIAWDGDFDRCFFFDEHGGFVEGYYIVGLLAEAFLQKNNDETIIYDPRVYWNTEATIIECGGRAVMSKTGHAYIKARMREEDAIYGGEMSAHHYFRDFAYCDSGMIPWLLVIELLSVKGMRLSELLGDVMARFPSSGEINFRVNDPAQIMSRIEHYPWCQPVSISYIDGLDMCFEDWRFNLRMSNTEPVLRLNIETKHKAKLLEEKVQQLKDLIAESDAPNDDPARKRQRSGSFLKQ